MYFYLMVRKKRRRKPTVALKRVPMRSLRQKFANKPGWNVFTALPSSAAARLQDSGAGGPRLPSGACDESRWPAMGNR